jgi:hypothetical protein
VTDRDDQIDVPLTGDGYNPTAYTGRPDHGRTLTVDTHPTPVIVRVNRVLATIALILGILLMGGALYLGTAVGVGIKHTVDDLHTRLAPTDIPDPDVPTGCPFGDNECGG